MGSLMHRKAKKIYGLKPDAQIVEIGPTGRCMLPALLAQLNSRASCLSQDKLWLPYKTWYL
jgi:hypothetical protein